MNLNETGPHARACVCAVNLSVVNLQPFIHTLTSTVAHGRLTAASECVCVRVFVLKLKLSMLLCVRVKSLGFHGNNLGEQERGCRAKSSV